MSNQNGGYRGRVLGVEEGEGISGVLVSDGFQVVQTDAERRYCLPRAETRVKFISVTVPAGYRAERWQCELGAPILGPAAISGNGVYVADFGGNVYAFAAG